jgi:hypothetical protein
VTDEKDYLIVGYKNGGIALFDIEKTKNKFADETIHFKSNSNKSNSLLDIKIINEKIIVHYIFIQVIQKETFLIPK